jgi:hypothetical protein
LVAGSAVVEIIVVVIFAFHGDTLAHIPAFTMPERWREVRTAERRAESRVGNQRTEKRE